MDEAQGAKHLVDCIECVDSLRDACKEAGGGIGLGRLKDMSALALIYFIAGNKIRFTYTGLKAAPVIKPAVDEWT